MFTASKINPRIFILGPPASGKTTAIQIIESILIDNNISVHTMGIEESLRIVCPRNICNNNYVYKPDGSLILLNSTQVIGHALNHLIETCNNNSAKGFLVELAHLKLGKAIRQFPNKLFSGALIIHIDASLEKRIERNARRLQLRMPDLVIKQYSRLSCDDLNFLKSSGADVVSVFEIDSLIEFNSLIYKHISAWLDTRFLR